MSTGDRGDVVARGMIETFEGTQEMEDRVSTSGSALLREQVAVLRMFEGVSVDSGVFNNEDIDE